MLCVPGEPLRDRPGVIDEILVIPVEDLGNAKGFRVGPVAAAITQEPLGCIIELFIQPGGDKSFVTQCGAADGGAIDRHMNARVIEVAGFPDHFVFDLVQRAFLAEQGEQAFLPCVVEQGPKFANRFDIRISRQDEIDRVGVVGIDQERQLLIAVEGVVLARTDRGQFGQIRLKRSAFGLESWRS